ncbi:putative integral membrane protein (TIGR00698 family) [Rhizomicrobium electricum]|nr:putative integral membrane protein (TIGR00698 family) [Rhizomicrobium electricum]
MLPGLLLTAALAAFAGTVHTIRLFSGLSPLIIAIVLGMAFHNLIGTPVRAKAGVGFSMRRILRFAIILIGLQLTAQQVAQVGLTGLVLIAVVLGATFVFTKWLGRRLGVESKLAELIAAGTSICGASAVIATNTVTDAPDEDVAYAVACVTVFGGIAMLVYPLFPALLHLTPHQYGLWAGSSIHEIAQVVGAAFQDGKEAGEFATITKLSRIAMLAPLVIGLGLIKHYGKAAKHRRPVPLPWFVLGFVALVGLNSVVTIPAADKQAVAAFTAFLLSMALAGMGLETDFAKLRAKGLKPLLLGFAAFLFVAGFSLMLIELTA